MSIEFYPAVAKIKRNGVYQNLPGFYDPIIDLDSQQMIATAEANTTAQYPHAIGEYFRLDGTLYRATQNIAAGGTISVGENCEVAVLGNDTSKIAKEVDSIEEVLNAEPIIWNNGAYITTNGTVGNVISLTPTTYSGYRCAVVNCSEGDTFIFSGLLGGSVPRLYAFVDSDNKLLTTRAPANFNQNYFLVTAPANATKAILNDHHNPLNGEAYIGITPKSANYIKDLTVGKTYFAGTISGTKMGYLYGQMPKGHYLLHIDSIVSSDTDGSYSRFIVGNANDETILIRFLERNKPIDLYFELFEASEYIILYAGENATLSTSDTFTYNNLVITKLSGDSEKTYLAYKYIKYPYHELAPNPYQCHFNNFEEVISTTHAHCTTDTELVNYTRKYDHVAFSNYHPSMPWYPLEDFFSNPLLYQEYKNTLTGTKMEQVTISLPAGDYILTATEIVSSDTDVTTSRVTFVYDGGQTSLKLDLPRGEDISQEFTLTSDVESFYVYASDTAVHSNGDTYTFSNLTFKRKISDALDNFLSSPNAEYAGFAESTYPSNHINAVGSFFSRETTNNGDTEGQVISCCLNSLQYAQMGGMTLNHPSYYGTLLSPQQVYELVSLYPFFGLEIYNACCQARHEDGFAITQWDYVLARGRQIYGLAVPDHELQDYPDESRVGFGYCHVMVRAKTEQQILDAYSKGRFYTSIYNGTLKFTDLYYDYGSGLSVNTNESCTIKIITANGVVSTVTGTTATYTPAYNDVYIRVEATDGTNTLYSNAIFI